MKPVYIISGVVTALAGLLMLLIPPPDTTMLDRWAEMREQDSSLEAEGLIDRMDIIIANYDALLGGLYERILSSPGAAKRWRIWHQELKGE